MPRPDRHPLIAGTWIVSLGTLASRVLGMLRDMATAAVLGMSGSGVMDAFVLAFRIPNTFRRLFGEGALTASYLPVLAEKLEQDRKAAWQVASVTLTGLAVVLAAVVLAIETGLAFWWAASGGSDKVQLLIGLCAVMMPYMLLICLAAQVAATLNALGHFATPALVPTLLNIAWLSGAWLLAPRLTDEPAGQAYVLAWCVLAAGVLQLGVQLPVLRRLGFRFDLNWPAARPSVVRIVMSMGPMVVGLAITQINTLVDSFLAWGLARAPDGPERIAWLGLPYPMQQGAAAAIYFGERLYQFPMGILGLAVATAIFPLLSRHAARGDHHRLAADLTLGLRLVLFLGVPASAGLVLLSEPLTRLLFERGRFQPEDTVRAARVIACYSTAVWAFCALPVLVRGYYAWSDRITPVRVGAAVIVLDLAMNLALIWPLAEAGLAVATAISACVQAVALAVLFSRHKTALGWNVLGATALRTAVATALMGAAVGGLQGVMPEAESVGAQLATLAAVLATALLVFLAAYVALRGEEPRILLRGIGRTDDAATATAIEEEQ